MQRWPQPLAAVPPALPPPMVQFMQAVAGARNQPLVTPREAAARVAVMEAMYKGSKERKWVSIPA